MSALVPIIVTGDWLQPDNSETPLGDVSFLLTEEIQSPQVCSARLIPAGISFGALAQQLYANDLDSDGDPIAPARTMYRVTERVDGAAEVDYFITVPAVPPGSRTVTDAAVTEGVQTVSSLTASFTDDDVGAYVLLGNGSVVPPGTRITAVVSASVAQLSRTPQVDASGLTLMIGASADLAALRPPAN